MQQISLCMRRLLCCWLNAQAAGPSCGSQARRSCQGLVPLSRPARVAVSRCAALTRMAKGTAWSPERSRPSSCRRVHLDAISCYVSAVLATACLALETPCAAPDLSKPSQLAGSQPCMPSQAD